MARLEHSAIVRRFLTLRELFEEHGLVLEPVEEHCDRPRFIVRRKEEDYITGSVIIRFDTIQEGEAALEMLEYCKSQGGTNEEM